MARLESSKPAESSAAVLARARLLSNSNHRDEALQLLQRYLAGNPRDSDARLLYGNVLAWAGLYEEARTQLSQVVTEQPKYVDALLSLINVELWSGHPARAEQIAQEGLVRTPDDSRLKLALAQALEAEGRDREGARIVDEVLKADSSNEQARRLSDELGNSSTAWEASLDNTYEWFSSGSSPQDENHLALRHSTSAGPVIARFSRAYRFDTSSNQGEIDFYPSIRPSTYGYLNVGLSDGVLYPRYRIGGDLFQNFGARFEASAGYRRLQFPKPVNIYTGSIAKYQGNWYFSLRPFFSPDLTGTSYSLQLSARRYFGPNGLHDYVGIRVGHGRSLEARSLIDMETLNSTFAYADLDKSIGHWAAEVHTGVSRDDLLYRSGVRRYLADGGIYYRF